MNLEADMPFGMSLVDFFLSQIGNCGPVDEGLNTSSLGDDTKFIRTQVSPVSVLV